MALSLALFVEAGPCSYGFQRSDLYAIENNLSVAIKLCCSRPSEQLDECMIRSRKSQNLEIYS